MFLWASIQVSAQITVLKPYSPSGKAATPQTYSTTPAPQAAATPQNDPSATETVSDRRNAALSKVQWAGNKPVNKSLAAKGVSPAQYSTDSPAPVEYSAAPNPSTTMTVNGLSVQRNVRKGSGQVGNELFTPVSELFFVQFAVYCKDTPVDKAPTIDGLFLLWHAGSKCPGGEEGASYIVKGYNTADEAKAAVLEYKANRIDCWFNPALTGAEVEVIGIR